jgi:hypothetical protein
MAGQGFGQGNGCVCVLCATGGRDRGGLGEDAGGSALSEPTHLRPIFCGGMVQSARVGPLGRAVVACASRRSVPLDHFGRPRTEWIALLEMPSCPHIPFFCPKPRCVFSLSIVALLAHLTDDQKWPSTEPKYNVKLNLEVKERMDLLHCRDVSPFSW